MTKIIDTTDPNYVALRKQLTKGKYNGAYYYSQEIAKNIIPLVKTDRPWNTLGARCLGLQPNAIVFLHHNINHDRVYGWMRGRVRNNIFVVNAYSTYSYIQRRGWPVIYLPNSVDVEYVKQFRTEKTKEACYAGNRWRFKQNDIKKYVPAGTDFPPEELPREELLKFIAPYKKCYAIGRCAVEAKILGCEVENCDSRYEGVDWTILDNKDAAKLLQEALDQIESHLDKPRKTTNQPLKRSM